MPAIIIIDAVGPKEYVNGIKMLSVVTTPMPGSMLIIVPTTQPIKHKIIF